MRWVVHTLGDSALIAAAIGLVTGLLVGVIGRLPFVSWRPRGVRAPILAGATAALAAAILGVDPHGGRQFPAEGTFEGWRWRWLGDIPDIATSQVFDDYTASIALLNFALFAMWGVVLAWALNIRRIWRLAATVRGFPLVLESLQRYPFGGTPSVTDAWTNTLGGLVGVGVVLVSAVLVEKWRTRSQVR